jgi:hypothetical protein
MCGGGWRRIKADKREIYLFFIYFIILWVDWMKIKFIVFVNNIM